MLLMQVLDQPRVREILVLGLFLVLPAMFALKIAQVFFALHVPLTKAVSIGIETRLDDPSFWTICAASVASYMIFVGSTLPRCDKSAPKTSLVHFEKVGLVAWVIVFAFGSVIYLKAVRAAGETFWFPHSGKTSDASDIPIQWVEGCLNLYAMAVSYFFVMLAFCTVHATRSSEKRTNLECRLKCYCPTYILYPACMPFLLVFLLYLIEKIGFSGFLISHLGWTFAFFKGTTPDQAFGAFVLFWAPNIVLLTFALCFWLRDLRLGKAEVFKWKIPTLTLIFCECDCKRRHAINPDAVD